MKTAKLSLLFPLWLVFYELISYLANDMYLPSLPTMAHELNTTSSIAKDTMLYWFLGSASVQLILGPLADRYGRRKILLAGALLFIVSSFACAITHNIIIMLIARFIQGSTVCAVIVAGYSTIHESYDTDAAIKITSIMSSIIILAPGFGPLLGAVVIEIWNWRTIFYLLAVGGILCAYALHKVMPETNPQPVPFHLGTIVKDYYSINKRIAFLGYTLPFCLLFMPLVAWMAQTPFIFIEAYHKSVITYGILQAIVFGGFILGAQVTRLSVGSITPFTLIEYGLIIAFVASSVMMLTSLFGHPHLYFIIFLMTIIAFGSSLAFGPLYRLAVEACSEAMGRRIAVTSTWMAIFGVLGVFVVSLLRTDNMSALTIIVAACVILSFSIFTLTKKLGHF